MRTNLTKRQLAMAAAYVPLYDMLCELVHAIKDDPEACREMKVLARRGRKVLDAVKARVPNTVVSNPTKCPPHTPDGISSRVAL